MGDVWPYFTVTQSCTHKISLKGLITFFAYLKNRTRDNLFVHFSLFGTIRCVTFSLIFQVLLLVRAHPLGSDTDPVQEAETERTLTGCGRASPVDPASVMGTHFLFASLSSAVLWGLVLSPSTDGPPHSWTDASQGPKPVPS